MIQNYADFIETLLKAGFSMGGGNNEGVFSVIGWNWNEAPPYETPVRWHTGDPETDPWEWRMRVLDERDDIAYAKLFFRKSGFITKEWYPYFLAARRSGMSFEEEYTSGKISQLAKKIYDIILEYEVLPLHAIKQIAGITRENKSRFDRTMIELQKNMILTMCGRKRKLSQKGEEYGWSSTVFCRVESYFGDEIFQQAGQIDKQKAVEKISEQIYKLNPEAESKKISKFIYG